MAPLLVFLSLLQSLSRGVCIQLFFLCSLGCGKNQTYFSIYGRVVPAPMPANMNTYMQFRHDETYSSVYTERKDFF